MAALVQPSWKDAAIAKSETITDAWEVFKIFAGRLAEWILFGCMIANILEMLPGVNFWPLAANIVMATQIITLDIAGFGLASMAEHARENGHEEAAREASRTAKWLIGIMITTLVLVTAGVLIPMIRPYLGYAEDVLILVRVVMVVLYGHVIHKLRRLTSVYTPPAGHLEEITRLQQALEHTQMSIQEAHQEKIDNLQQALQHATQSCQELESRTLSDAQQWGARIATLETKNEEEVAHLVSQITSLSEQVKQHISEQIATGEASLSEQENDGDSDASIIHLVNNKASLQTSRGDAVKRVQRVIKRTPNITPTELAKRANISRSYASQLLKQYSA